MREALLGVAAALLLSACGGASCDKPRRYDRETSRPRLEVPEDLNSPKTATPFTIPDVAPAALSGDKPCTDYPPNIRVAEADAAQDAATDEDPVPTGTDLAEAIDAIRNNIEGWAAAWSAGDFESFISYYSAQFEPPGDMTFDDWQVSRARRLSEGAKVDVLPETLTVELDSGTTASASFVQRFQAGTILTQVVKNILVVKENGQWKIKSERVINML